MIHAKNLSRSFGNRVAVDALNLDVARGEVFGLLGPNGAGKTTTVRMLTTLLRPSGGSAQVAGFDITAAAPSVRRSIGYAPQEINLDRELTGFQNLLLHGMYHGMKNARSRCLELLSWAQIETHCNDPVRTYSGGMQRRLQIARSVMHEPAMLFLDEPTVGLDPQIRRTIWELIRSLQLKNIGVVLTTHYIEEAEYLCSRVGIMNRGRLIACDTPKRLTEDVGAWVVETQVESGMDYSHFEDHESAVAFAKGEERRALRIRRATLEDAFIRLSGERFPQ